MRCTLTLLHPTGVQIAVLVEDLAQVDAVISELLAKGYRPLSGPASATPSAASPPVAAEPPAPSALLPQAAGDAPPAAGPRGCEHLPVPPNDLQVEWVRRFPDEAVRDAWFAVGKRRLRCKKGAALIGDTIPLIIAEALLAYDEFKHELARQGRHVNGEALWPPKRE